MINFEDENQVKLLEERELMQHNAITSGRYDFSACQLDIMFMLLGFLEKGQDTYRIYAKDIETITGREWKYGQLREATENMGSRMFEIETEKSYKQIWLFSQVEYITGTGSFEVSISKHALPYFFDLKNNFTVLKLKAVLSCSSKYAKRLYAFACQWRRAGYRKMSISEFKEMLGLIDKKGFEQYKQIGQFKDRVLEVAKRQINENTDIEFDYRFIKRGRSFQEIEIFINRSQTQAQMQIDFNQDLGVQKFRAYLQNNTKLNTDQIDLISQRETYENFHNEIRKASAKYSDFLENPTPYIVGIYQNKGILPRKK